MADKYPVEEVTFDVDKCLLFEGQYYPPAKVIVVRPKDENGQERDQSQDAGNNMRYAATLDIPTLPLVSPHGGRAVIVGGAPSIKDQLPKIKELAATSDTAVFALNWSHNWLLQNGIVPQGCVFYEIDAEPDNILEQANPKTVYFVCSHCHPKTFDQLLDKVPNSNVMLWHRAPDCEPMAKAQIECYGTSLFIGGGISTFLNTVSIALALGYRNFDLFGVDSSFPEHAASTHVDGYPTIVDPNVDGYVVFARDHVTGEVRKFKTVGYLMHQVEEFKEYCKINHATFTMRVHGDGLLPFVHRAMWAGQYK